MTQRLFQGRSTIVVSQQECIYYGVILQCQRLLPSLKFRSPDRSILDREPEAQVGQLSGACEAFVVHNVCAPHDECTDYYIWTRMNEYE